VPVYVDFPGGAAGRQCGGAFLSSLILATGPDGRVLHMPELALLSLSLVFVGPVLMAVLEHRLRRATAAPAAALDSAPIDP